MPDNRRLYPELFDRAYCFTYQPWMQHLPYHPKHQPLMHRKIGKMWIVGNVDTGQWLDTRYRHVEDAIMAGVKAFCTRTLDF